MFRAYLYWKCWLPLARRIVTVLNDCEQHPDRYHDGIYREPPAEKRADYIHFYRSQAENFIAAAYTALGKTDDMEATFERLENIIVDATTHEHIASLPAPSFFFEQYGVTPTEYRAGLPNDYSLG